MSQPIRTFDTGATRSSIEGKLRYEGYFSPLVLRARAEYMQRHQTQANGELREPDNWQRGMPLDAYIDSAFRHFMDWWLEHRGHASQEGIRDAICALMFNAEGYLHALLSAVNGEHISQSVNGTPHPQDIFSLNSIIADPLEPPDEGDSRSIQASVVDRMVSEGAKRYCGEDSADPDREWHRRNAAAGTGTIPIGHV